MSTHKGQVMLLATILLAAAALSALASVEYAHPTIAYYTGELQSAELIAVARAYWVNRSNGGTLEMQKALSKVYNASKEWNIRVPRVKYTNVYTYTPESSGYGYYKTYFSNSVCFVAEWRWQFQGTYVRRVHGALIVYRNYTLYYAHRYYIPQLAGNFTLYPRLWDPAGAASLNETSPGLWVVGFPAGNSTYSLVDEFGIRIEVGG